MLLVRVADVDAGPGTVGLRPSMPLALGLGAALAAPRQLGQQEPLDWTPDATLGRPPAHCALRTQAVEVLG